MPGAAPLQVDDFGISEAKEDQSMDIILVPVI